MTNIPVDIESCGFLTSPQTDSRELMKHIQNHFLSILNALHNDLVIVDKNGFLILVLPNFEDFYGIPATEALNKTVYDLESRKILTPSIAANVLRSNQEQCMLQRTLTGKYLMCYATPVFDENNEILYVLSYSRDLTQYESMKRQYDYLNQTIAAYPTAFEYPEDEPLSLSDIIGDSLCIRNSKNTLLTFSKFDANVLLTGESGVGKTLYAKMIHANSIRKARPFIYINCGAIPEALFESEFFGYEKGAFTGAKQSGKIGLIESANTGTLFLDEIADLPLDMQVKLLKLLDTHTVTRVGGTEEISVDFRLVAATNKNIPDLINQGKFREDLYFRLNLLSLEIPSLCDHLEDVPALINHFLEVFLNKYGITKMFSTKSISALMDYSWPGNIRELENIVERLCLITKDELINYDDLPQHIRIASEESNTSSFIKMTLPEILESVERDVILEAYEKYKTTTKVAQMLGISQPSASIKLKKYLDK